MAEYNNGSISNYYASENGGGYQYQSINDLVNTFLAMYVGENKLISKASRQDVFFFGRRALQEMNYDTLRSKKTLEFELDNRMYMIMPHDFVGYTHVFVSDANGIKRPLYPTKDTQNPTRWKVKDVATDERDLDNWFETQAFDAFAGGIITTGLEEEDPKTTQNFSNSQTNNTSNSELESNNSFNNLAEGQRYGLQPSMANANGSFYFDYAKGRLYFGPSLIGQTIVLDYITDGLADDGDSVIHKFAEEAWYKSVAYAIVSTGSNYSPASVQMLKKERFAEMRKAKIRLSNYKSQELAQIMRNKSKWIKH